MRRHPNRLSPAKAKELGVGKRNGRLVKRGPKNKKRSNLLNYTIERGVGVVFHD